MAAKKALVVATTAPGGSQIRDLVGAAEEIRIVTPAAQVSWLDWLTNAEDDARREAQETSERVASAVEGEARVEIDRTSQNTDAAEAIKDALREFEADEIVVLTRPGEDTNWLEDEAVRAALDQHGIPVRHLELEPT
jgi:hypothetical protein